MIWIELEFGFSGGESFKWHKNGRKLFTSKCDQEYVAADHHQSEYCTAAVVVRSFLLLLIFGWILLCTSLAPTCFHHHLLQFYIKA